VIHERSTIPVICGPTGAGKSAVAMWLAARHPIEIVSADSRHIYRGFDVGTAKPSAGDRARVPHHGVDVVAPTQRWSAADWAGLAAGAIRGAWERGRIPVVVGGTGFYIATLFRPFWVQPALDEDRRRALQAALAPLSIGELRRWCAELDPARAGLGRAQLLRAVEVALLTGARLSGLHVANATLPTFRARYLLVDPGPVLASRIAERTAAMWDAGWPEEVKRLQASVPDDAPAWKATGYAMMRRFVRGDVDRSAALERIIIETRQYAKRQRTWFRHQLEPDLVSRVSPDAREWRDHVEGWMNGVERVAPERAE